MKPENDPSAPSTVEPPRRMEAGPWAIELLPGSAYAARYVASQSAIGFAFDSQRGVHAIGSDRVQPFLAMPNGLAFVPAGCDVFSESPTGGEYLRVLRTDGVTLKGTRAFNNRIDPRATQLALRMRSALLRASVSGDWEAWAHGLADCALHHQAIPTPPPGALTSRRMAVLDEFIDAGLGETLGVQAMAQVMGLSEGCIMRAFKAATGQSPHGYLIDRRLAKARTLMRDSRATLAEIALAAGFSSQAHMATVFKHRLGVSPTHLRQ